MDYIKLKKTLMAVFDHFLSCHDMHDLEQMMQAFEAGKGLNIRLPTKIHRSDYKDDLQFMMVSKPKTIKSRVRKTKPKNRPETSEHIEHICDVPIIMSLDDLTHEKYLLLRDVLKDKKHKITFKNTLIQDMHGFATAVISRVVQRKNIVKRALFPLSSENFERDDFGYKNSTQPHGTPVINGVTRGRESSISTAEIPLPLSSENIRKDEMGNRVSSKNVIASKAKQSVQERTLPYEIASSFHSSQRRASQNNSSFIEDSPSEKDSYPEPSETSPESEHTPHEQHSYSFKAGTSFEDVIHQSKEELSFREKILREIKRRMKGTKDPP